MLGFEDCLSRLGPVGVHVSLLDAPEESTAIEFAADGLRFLPRVDRDSLAQWVAENPTEVYVLGPAVGLSRERLKNTLRHRFETSSEDIARGPGLQCTAHSRFTGRNNRTAPCDPATSVPSGPARKLPS